MAPLRGWAPRGRRLHAKVPHGRWKTMTFLAALRHDRIDAPWFIEGPIDGVSFRTYVAKVLLPVLRPGDIVVLDNLGSHRSKAVRQLIRSVGAQTVLPAKVLARPEPDRTGICQAQASAPQSCRPNRRCGLRRNRPRTRCLHRRRMRQLPQKFRLSNLMPSRFSANLALRSGSHTPGLSLRGTTSGKWGSSELADPLVLADGAWRFSDLSNITGVASASWRKLCRNIGVAPLRPALRQVSEPHLDPLGAFIVRPS